MDSAWLGFDRITSGVLFAGVMLIGAYAAWPGALQELAPRATVRLANRAAGAGLESGVAATRDVPPAERFEVWNIPHAHAAGWGSWILLVGVFVVVMATAWQQRRTEWLLAAIATAAIAIPLLASQWEGEVAVASALRWLSPLALAVGSLPIWCRGWIAAHAPGVEWRGSRRGSDLALEARLFVFLLALAPALLVAAGIVTAALEHATAAPSVLEPLFAFALPVAMVGAAVLWMSHASSAQRQTAHNWPRATSALALVLSVAPLVAMSAYYLTAALSEYPIVGPNAGSVFASMGQAAAYGLPVVATALVLVLHAIRERSSSFALAGGLTLNLAASIAYLLHVAEAGSPIDPTAWIRVAQINAAVAAVYAIAWTALAWRAAGANGARRGSEGDLSFGVQVALAPGLMALLLAVTWANLVADPKQLGQGPQQLVQPSLINPAIADPAGWASLALAAAAVAAATWSAGRRPGMGVISAGLIALAVMAAAVAAPWDIGNWVSYNTLLVGHVAIAAVLVAIAWIAKRRRTDEQNGSAVVRPVAAAWIELQAAILVVLSLREVVDNSLWPAIGFAALTLLGAVLAWVYERRRYLYQASLALNLAGSFAWAESKLLPGIENFWYLNVALLALPAVPWLLIELRGIRRGSLLPGPRAAPAHRFVAVTALAALALLVGMGLYGDAVQQRALQPNDVLAWGALALVLVAAATCLWDAAAGGAVAMLYVVGLVAVGMLLDRFDLTPKWLLWTGNMVVAAYTVATSYLWSRRASLRAIATQLGIPASRGDSLAHLAWLVPLNLFVAGSVVFLTGIVELTEADVLLRVPAAQAALAQVVSLALLARGDRRRGLQSLTLQLGAVAAAMFGWAWLQPGATLTLLHALVVLAAALAAVAMLYGFGLVKLLSESSDWLPAARRLTPWLAGIVAASILAALGVEVFEFSRWGAVRIAWPAVVAVAVTFAGLAVAALAAAVLPGRDPLGLSERGRTLYVYAAEIALALLFVHVRITMPWLFHGFFQQYWPLVVMAIAFFGVGFAEFCRRRRQFVLAEPIENTGALLPVLPVLGFWAIDTRVDYSLLLLAVGVLYAGLSIARRSFGFGILAALAANGGLWYFLNRQEGFELLRHPQIWLIPPAVCVLAAAYLNRPQLAEAQMTTVRYLASMTVYVSSTADVFLNGVAQNPWLPVVLAGLSIGGILAGIVLRVRAFLFLGTSFLGLSLFTIIWYAAVDLDQTWIWYATVVAAGALIITLFAIFEKKRQEMLDVLEKLKQWEA